MRPTAQQGGMWRSGIGSPVVRTFDGETDWAIAVADALTEKFQIALGTHNTALVALAGGNTPGKILPRLADRSIEWGRLIFIPTDERCVPDTHRDSNYGALARWLADASGGRARLASLNTAQGSPSEVSARLNDQASRCALWPPRVVLLGMGTDGHVASLFPGDTDALCSKDAWVKSSQPQGGVHRLSLSVPTLSQAQNIIVAVSGADKARMISDTIRESEVNPSVVVHNNPPPIGIILSLIPDKIEILCCI